MRYWIRSVVVGVLVASAFVAVRSSTVFGAPNGTRYRLVDSWLPVPRNAEPLWEMNGAAVNREGTLVYATRRYDPPILEIDAKSGKILNQIGAGLLVWPHGVSVDRDGFVWAADATVGDPPSL